MFFTIVSIVLTKIFKEIMNWEARHPVSYGWMYQDLSKSEAIPILFSTSFDCCSIFKEIINWEAINLVSYGWMYRWVILRFTEVIPQVWWATFTRFIGNCCSFYNKELLKTQYTADNCLKFNLFRKQLIDARNNW